MSAARMTQKPKMKVWGRVFKYVRPRWMLVVLAIGALIGNVSQVFAPMLIARSIDAMVGAGQVDFQSIIYSIVILAVLYLLSALMLWLVSFVSVKLAYSAVGQMRKEAFDTVTRLPLKTLDNMAHGDILSRLGMDCDSVADGLNQLLNQLFSAAVIICSALGFMLYMSPLVTLAVVIATPIVFFVSRLISRRTKQHSAAQQRVLGELSGYVEERVRGLKTITAYNASDYTVERFGDINSRLHSSGFKANFYSSLVNPSTRMVNYISYMLTGLTAGLSAMYLGLGVGSIAAFLTYSALFSKPFNELSAITSNILTAAAGAERVFALTNMDREPADEEGATVLTDPQGNISFDDVSFYYDKSRPLIKNFDLNVVRGSKIAIVGPTGAGKTTIINLIMRFYDTAGGEISLDGHPIKQVTRDSYRRSYGMVLQETWTFEGTVRDNIAYGKPDASQEEVEAAATAAGAHSFILKLTKGYDTVLDDDNRLLSQGQLQMLTIARAMIISPPILILDEATSSVDIITERKIQETFIRIIKDRTSFVIAHRLSTIIDADTIIVMDKGSVIETGSHKELMDKGGFYHTLYNSQFESSETVDM